MSKKLMGILAIVVGAILLILVIGYKGGLHFTATTSTNSAKTPMTITYNFDSGNPTLKAGESTPLTQTVNGVSATFSSPSDPAAFSIQNQRTTFYVLPLFSGNYLWDDKSYRVELEIRFSQPITSISLSFATVEQYASMERDKLSILQLAAFLSESTTTLVGSTSAQGSVLSGTFPQGTLSYSAGGRLFNQVRLTIPPQPYPAAQFYIDNIVIITS